LGVWLVSWGILGAAFLLVSRHFALNIPFWDETDHVAVGTILAQTGGRLYRDVVTIHQPLPVLVGTLVGALARRSNMLVMISDIRLAMNAFLLAWGAALIVRFRTRGGVVAVATLGLSYWYCAGYVLAESLCLPAVATCVLLLGEWWWPEVCRRPREWPAWSDGLLLGLANWWGVFNLLPLGPFLLAVDAIYVWHVWPERARWQRIALPVVTVLALAAALCLYVTPGEWWTGTIGNYLTAWRQVYDGPALSQVWGIYLSYPFWAAAHFRTASDAWWIIVSVLLVATAGRLAWQRRWRSLGAYIIVYLLVTTLNLRVWRAPVVWWEGFHLYPQVVGWWGMMALSVYMWRSWGRCLVGGGLALGLVLAGGWWRLPDTRWADYEAGYAASEAVARALGVLADPGDRLWTGEEGYGYINMLAGVPFGDRQNFHFSWGWAVPALREDFVKTMETKPPEFVYLVSNNDNDFMGAMIHDYLPRLYTRLRVDDQSPTDMYILNDKAAQIDEARWQEYAATTWWLIPAVASASATPRAD
ncbi:hypothetical protein IJJ12_02600, partial [bacterium]|nr:hypothetical protein [bacterium]